MGAILIVEDDAELAEVVGLLLQDAGHQVTTASSYDEALGVVMRGPPQIVLADWNVPGGTALDLRDELESRGLGHVPVVAMTGMPVEPERLVEFAAVLTKPFPASRLVDLVHGLLGTADPARF
jgi:CheY-like chemotaxis protein